MSKRVGWLAAVAMACHVSTLPPGGVAEREHAATISSSELRVRTRALVGPYLAGLEHAADEAGRRCVDEGSVQTRALEWKITAIPLAQNALFQPDPLVAFLDGWAYARQMRDFLLSDVGRAEFGSCAASAAAEMERLTHSFRAIAGLFGSSHGMRAERFVDDWAAAHPLASLSQPRATVTEVLADETVRQDLGALAAVGTMVETLEDLTVRIAAYRETILKEARWTGELVELQATRGDLAVRAAADIDRMAKALDLFAALAGKLPSLVERQRVATLTALREEREVVMADIDRQRVDTLQKIQSQGDTVLARVDALTAQAIDAAGAQARQVVDRVFLRVVELTAALLLALVVIVLLVWHVLAPRWRARPPTV